MAVLEIAVFEDDFELLPGSVGHFDYDGANEALDTERRAETEQPPAPDAGRTYTVKSGDSLTKIAEEKLGDGNRFQEIYKANKDKLRSPDDIRVGMKLRLPAR